MQFVKLTADEAAAMIKNGQTVALSGFTPAGTPKCTPDALAKRAEALHKEGKEFKINLLTGASTGNSCDGELSEAGAINFRAPYTTNVAFRKHSNNNEIIYSDLCLSQVASQIRQGYLGQIDWAIVEACHIDVVGDKARIYITSGVGISPTISRVAKEGIIIELNHYHTEKCIGLHDIYELQEHPFRTPIMITKATDRIGVPYIEVEAKRIKGVIECNMPDEARGFEAPDAATDQIGQNVADFLMQNLRQGLIPKTFLNLQSGVGNVSNAVLGAIGQCKEIPNFNVYTEVLQDAPFKLFKEGRILSASSCSLSVTNDCLQEIYHNMDDYKGHIVLRPAEISNNPEVIARIGVCSLNTAIEADIYGHVNSTKLCGTKMMNGIGGSADFTNNAYLSIFTCRSEVKNGAISSIVPFCSHIDHTSHFIDAIATEYGVADLRHKSSMEMAEAMIAIAHPDYRPILREYLKIAAPYGGHTHHCLNAAFALHDTFLRKGDMRKVDWNEYIKK